MKNIVVLVTTPATPYSRAESLLNQVLAYAAFEYRVMVVFQNAGILQLYSQTLAPQWTMLPDYDVTELYISEKTLQTYPDTLSTAPLSLKPITTNAIIRAIRNSHWTATA
jgi:sulfur relay (sulfurtransferase) DsrF/TusC family protein